MLSLLPRAVPDLPELLADLGNPSTQRLAAALDVSERTVWRWRSSGAPLAVRLALYWLTPWGWDAHECEARRKVADWRELSECLRHELAGAEARIQRLEALGDFGSANAPSLRPIAAPAGEFRAAAPRPTAA